MPFDISSIGTKAAESCPNGGLVLIITPEQQDKGAIINTFAAMSVPSLTRDGAREVIAHALNELKEFASEAAVPWSEIEACPMGELKSQTKDTFVVKAAADGC